MIKYTQKQSRKLGGTPDHLMMKETFLISKEDEESKKIKGTKQCAALEEMKMKVMNETLGNIDTRQSFIVDLVSQADDLFDHYQIYRAFKIYKRAFDLYKKILDSTTSAFKPISKDDMSNDCKENRNEESTLRSISNTFEVFLKDEIYNVLNISIILNRISLCHLFQGEIPFAIKSLEKSLDYFDSANLDCNHSVVISTKKFLHSIDHILFSIEPAIDLNSQGQELEFKGQHDKAVKAYSRALSILIMNLTEVHPFVASTLNKIGVVQWKKGNYKIAKKTLIEASHVIHLTLGEIHIENADIFGCLGSVFLALGDHSGAMHYYKQALSVQEKCLGYDHPDVAKTITHIGMVYGEEGKLRKAMKLYEVGLCIQKETLGALHVDVAATLNSIGVIQEKQQLYAESMSSYKEALHIYNNSNNVNHVDVAVTLNNIGEVHRHLGRYDDAMKTYKMAMNTMIGALGKDHRNVAATLHNIGLTYSSKGDHSKALTLYKKALAMQRSALGNDHPDVALTLTSMGEVYERRGDAMKNESKSYKRYEKAAILYNKALSARRASLGHEHVFIAITLVKLGEIYRLKVKDFRRASNLYHEALQIYRINKFQDDHPYIVEVVKFIS